MDVKKNNICPKGWDLPLKSDIQNIQDYDILNLSNEQEFYTHFRTHDRNNWGTGWFLFKNGVFQISKNNNSYQGVNFKTKSPLIRGSFHGGKKYYFNFFACRCVKPL